MCKWIICMCRLWVHSGLEYSASISRTDVMLALLWNFQYVNQCSLNILLFRKERGGNTLAWYWKLFINVKNVTVCSGYLSHALPRVRQISLAAIPLMFFLNNQCKHLGKIGHSNLQSKSSTSSFLPPSLSSMWVLTAISMGWLTCTSSFHIHAV